MKPGYPTSKNRVSMGLSLSVVRMSRLRDMAGKDGVSAAEMVGQLVDAEWLRRKDDDSAMAEPKEATVAA